MNIRVECLAGDPPTWRVFLGPFFWPCTSKEDAEKWALSAAEYCASNVGPTYRLPAPLPPAKLNAGVIPCLDYGDDHD